MCSVRYPVSAINILKAHGKSAKESRLLDGYALNMGRAAQVRGVGSCMSVWLLAAHAMQSCACEQCMQQQVGWREITTPD